MKKRIAGIGVVAVMGLVAQIGIASMSMEGCSSDDATADAGDGAAAGDSYVDPCSLFTDAGEPCTLKTAVACFPECDFGGCFCLETPGGGGKRWSCTTDLSCIPDSAPIDDDLNAPLPPDDAGSGDASGDAGDASAIGDASNDATDAATSDATTSDAGALDASDGAIGDADAAD